MTTKLNAGNSLILKNIKRMFNAQIYKEALRLANVSNEEVAVAFVLQYVNEESRASMERAIHVDIAALSPAAEPVAATEATAKAPYTTAVPKGAAVASYRFPTPAPVDPPTALTDDEPITPSKLDAWKQMPRSELESLKDQAAWEHARVLNEFCRIRTLEKEIAEHYARINELVSKHNEALKASK